MLSLATTARSYFVSLYYNSTGIKVQT